MLVISVCLFLVHVSFLCQFLLCCARNIDVNTHICVCIFRTKNVLMKGAQLQKVCSLAADAADTSGHL